MGNYVVVDLEMCMVPVGCRTRNFRWASETIQIGAVLVDDNYEIIDIFNTLVRPEYGYIDSFIEGLTGITTASVKKAPVMKEALNSFLEWVPDDAVMVAWSDSDGRQLRREATGKHILSDRLESLITNCIDCQQIFGDRMEEKRAYSLEEALIAADIYQTGRAHDGFDDAFNTALLFAKLQQNDDIVLNPIYKAARSETSEQLSFSLGSLFAGLQFQPA